MRHLLATAGLATLIACGDDATTEPDGPDASPDSAPGCDRAVPWATAAPLPRGPTQETATVALSGNVYVIGGFDAAGAVLSAVQVYDTTSCAWSEGPELPLAVHHANVAVVDGTIFVVGAMVTISFDAIGDVWSWNPATDTGWTARAPMPAGSERGSAAVGAIAGRIYVAGGLRGGAVAEVSSYDPAADRWDTALPPLPEVRDHGCGASVDGRLYVVGGRRGGIDTIEGTVYEYTPGGTWSEKAPMLTPRGGTGCADVDGRIVVVGGEGNPATPSRVFPQAEAYSPSSDRWEALTPMPVPRHGMGAAAWGGRLYVPGGATRAGFGAVATHEVLTP